MAQKQFSSVTPPAPPGTDNVTWQETPVPAYPEITPQKFSAYVPRATGGGSSPVFELAITASTAGAFQVAHGLGATPALVLLTMTSGGEIWFQAAVLYDATYIYLVASAPGVQCVASIWAVADVVSIPLAPASAGDFTVPHGLGATPALAEIQMTSGGEIWFQSPPADGTNLYLVASAPGITGYAVVFALLPSPILVSSLASATLALAPSAPGPFKVAHGLPGVPSLILLQMQSGGGIWLQSPVYADGTYIYLVASAGGLSGAAQAWVTAGGSSAPIEVPFTSSAGDFTIAHGLGFTPRAAVVSMADLGAVVFQRPLRWDGTNFYLQGSAAGLEGFVEVWK
jgi:hypothetical protein